MLEFTIGSAALATGFSGYLQNLLAGTAFELPPALASAEEGVVNLPAVLIALAVMGVLIVGIKLSSVINQVVVAIKLTVVALVVVAGIGYIDASNYSPFVPPSEPSTGSAGSFMEQPLITSLLGLDPAVYGVAGVVAGAALVFFAFIGFDVVATTAEEAKNPQRDVPIGILGSLAIVTVLYMAVSLVITGMQNYQDIDPNDAAPLATAFDAVGVEWMGNLIAVGACIGLTVVVMILMLGQTRVAFAMARDGLLPRKVAKVHPHLRDAVPDHRDHRRRRRDHRRTGRPRDAGAPGQHRHALRVHPGQRRRGHPAPDPAGPPALLQGARRAGGGDPRGAALPVPDAQPHRGHLGAVRGVDGSRLRRLLRLQLPQQHGRAARRRGDRRRRHQPVALLAAASCR